MCFVFFCVFKFLLTDIDYVKISLQIRNINVLCFLYKIDNVLNEGFVWSESFINLNYSPFLKFKYVIICYQTVYLSSYMLLLVLV